MLPDVLKLFALPNVVSIFIGVPNATIVIFEFGNIDDIDIFIIGSLDEWQGKIVLVIGCIGGHVQQLCHGLFSEVLSSKD